MHGSRLPSLPPMNAHLLLKALIKRPAAGAGPHSFESTYEVAGIDAGQLGKYDAALGFRGHGVPVTFYYLLAQRAHLATMLAQRFPFRIPGIIHVENTLQQHAEPDGSKPIRLDTTASILPPGPNGAVHCVFETRGMQAGKLVFTCSSNYLAVRGQRTGKSGSRHEPAQPGNVVGGWTLDPSSGRAYASVSGDWNPIHLWPATARLMGLRVPIIHGMHTVAKACATLEGASGKKVILVSARFRSPIPLPGEARLAADLSGGTYAVLCGNRPAVEGTFATA